MTKENLLAFAIGCVTGAAVAVVALKDKYNQIADEKINSYKEEEEWRNSQDIPKIAEERHSEPKEPLGSSDKSYSSLQSENTEIIKEQQYKPYHEISKKPESQEDVEDWIEYIEPEDFGADTSYDIIEITLYADGILADDGDQIIDDIPFAVGKDYRGHIGEYETDILHVKNDKLKCYYELSYDSRNYTDVIS